MGLELEITRVNSAVMLSMRTAGDQLRAAPGVRTGHLQLTLLGLQLVGPSRGRARASETCDRVSADLDAVLGLGWSVDVGGMGRMTDLAIGLRALA